jgi:hypothetical protein
MAVNREEFLELPGRNGIPAGCITDGQHSETD